MITRYGKVALQQEGGGNNLPRRLQVEDVEYFPDLRNNVILVWVPEELGETVINSPANKTKSCNCGNGAVKPLYFYASQINVNIHETGHP